MGRERIGVRRSFTLPPKIDELLEEMAKQRIQELKLIGDKQMGSMKRDILCSALLIAASKLRQLKAFDFQQLCEETRK